MEYRVDFRRMPANSRGKRKSAVQGALVLSEPCCIPQAIEKHLLIPIEAPGDCFGRLVEQYDAFQREILPPADHPRLLKGMEYDTHCSFLEFQLASQRLDRA